MRSLLFRVAEGTVLAIFHSSRSCQGNVFEGMSQGASTAIAYGHVAVHFDGRDLVHQVNSVGTVFAKFVLCPDQEEILTIEKW